MSESVEQKERRLSECKRLRAKIDKELPDGWRDFWEHVALAVRKASGLREHSAMFTFVREIMRFRFSDDWKEDPGRIAKLIEQAHLRRLAEYNLACDRAYFWNDYGLEGGREEFIALWLNMRYPPGKDPLQLACEDSLRLSLKPKGASSLGFADVLTLAYHLQQRAGDRDIALPQQRIADTLGASQRIVSTYIALAVRRGYLIQKSGWDYIQRRAKSYRFRVDRFDEKGHERCDARGF